MIVKKKMLKILQACKPDSVFQNCLRKKKQLSFICDNHYWLPVSAYPPITASGGRSEQLHKLVYMAFQYARFTRLYNCLYRPWALTPHFHPYSYGMNHRLRLFSVALSRSLKGKPAVSRCVALYCPDFPTLYERIDSSACSAAKL